VRALVFDVDVQFFCPEFRTSLSDYLALAMPELEQRPTSAAGNLHAILHFSAPVKYEPAKAIWEAVRRLVFADPNANFLAKARVVGSLKNKAGAAAFRVVQIRRGKPIAAKRIIHRLTGDST